MDGDMDNLHVERNPLVDTVYIGIEDTCIWSLISSETKGIAKTIIPNCGNWDRSMLVPKPASLLSKASF